MADTPLDEVIANVKRNASRRTHSAEHPYIRLHGEILVDEIERLRTALRIIAGLEQCADNLMSNQAVAREALSCSTLATGTTLP